MYWSNNSILVIHFWKMHHRIRMAVQTANTSCLRRLKLNFGDSRTHMHTHTWVHMPANMHMITAHKSTKELKICHFCTYDNYYPVSCPCICSFSLSFGDVLIFYDVQKMCGKYWCVRFGILTAVSLNGSSLLNVHPVQFSTLLRHFLLTVFSHRQCDVTPLTYDIDISC